MRRTGLAVLSAIVCGLSCVPRGEAPREVDSLRQQARRKTIHLAAWNREVADEVTARAGEYAGKTFVIAMAYLDPREEVEAGKDFCRFPLAGGVTAIAATANVPAWLRPSPTAVGRTGAPLKLRGVLRRARPTDEDAAPAGPVLRVQSLDFAHPLELASVEVERAQDGTWLVAHVENYRGEGARATVELRFDTFRERRRLPAVAPGEATAVRLKLFGSTAPRWAELPPEQRQLSLLFDDGSAVRVDVGKWLEGPPESLLDLGYTFTPPGNAVLMLAGEEPAAELERFAALEFRSYLAQFTDANIEPREPDSPDPLPVPPQPLLVVGTAEHNALAAELVRQAGLEDRIRELGDDGYLLKSLRCGDSPALLVTAAAPRGVVNGVTALLERFGVQFSMFGARLPARGAFRLPEVDETRTPLFARRLLVAEGPERDSSAHWSQWQWLAMIDLAAKNRFNEVVFPLDGLEASFRYQPKGSRGALFPFEITPPYTCVAEAYLAHQRGLAILADYARRRGLGLSFARRSADGKLLRAAPPLALPLFGDSSEVGQPIAVLDDPGDLLGLPRVEEMAATAAHLLAAKATAIAAPYRRGATARVSFLAQFAWDKGLTPEASFRRWTGTLCEGEAADKLAKAILEFDRLDGDVLAAAPRPFGLGTPLVFPIEQGDLACDWAALRARATSASTAAQIAGLKDQAQKLHVLQARLEPILASFRAALGTLPPPWEAPLFESAPAARRGERISEGLVMFRSLLGAFSSVQEGALACYAGLTEPAQALPQLAATSSQWLKARRTVQWILRRGARGDMGPALERLDAELGDQTALLAEWLGPAAEAEPGARLTLSGSDAVVYLFRTRNEDIFAAYKLAGQETVQLRLNTQEARLVRRGQPPKTIHAEGGLFLVSLDTVPTYILARRAAWPGPAAP